MVNQCNGNVVFNGWGWDVDSERENVRTAALSDERYLGLRRLGISDLRIIFQTGCGMRLSTIGKEQIIPEVDFHTLYLAQRVGKGIWILGSTGSWITTKMGVRRYEERPCERIYWERSHVKGVFYCVGGLYPDTITTVRGMRTVAGRCFRTSGYWGNWLDAAVAWYKPGGLREQGLGHLYSIATNGRVTGRLIDRSISCRCTRQDDDLAVLCPASYVLTEYESSLLLGA